MASSMLPGDEEWDPSSFPSPSQVHSAQALAPAPYTSGDDGVRLFQDPNLSSLRRRLNIRKFSTHQRLWWGWTWRIIIATIIRQVLMTLAIAAANFTRTYRAIAASIANKGRATRQVEVTGQKPNAPPNCVAIVVPSTTDVQAATRVTRLWIDNGARDVVLYDRSGVLAASVAEIYHALDGDASVCAGWRREMPASSSGDHVRVCVASHADRGAIAACRASGADAAGPEEADELLRASLARYALANGGSPALARVVPQLVAVYGAKTLTLDGLPPWLASSAEISSVNDWGKRGVHRAIEAYMSAHIRRGR